MHDHCSAVHPIAAGSPFLDRVRPAPRRARPGCSRRSTAPIRSTTDRPACPELHPEARRGPEGAGRRGALHPSGLRPSQPRAGASTSSSRPARPAASRSRSTCPCSTPCRASRSPRALYLYPTKALAQDQARSLAELGVPRLRAAIYDGDTERERRWQIRNGRTSILTNPDMLHVGILPAPRPLGRRARQSPLRRRRRGARLPRRLRLARRPTCCAGCGGRRDLRRASRSSCSPRRRSPTPASWRRRSLGAPVDGDRRRRRAARRADDRALEPAAARRRARPARPARSARRHVCWRRWSRAACARSASPRAARPRSSSTASRASELGAATAPSASRRTAPATRPRSAARSSGGWSRASCSE